MTAHPDPDPRSATPDPAQRPGHSDLARRPDHPGPAPRSFDSPHLALALRYFEAIERDQLADNLDAFFDPAVEVHIYPNRLDPRGSHRDMAALRATAHLGARTVSDQRYAVRHVVAGDDTLALEIDWSARLRIPVATLPAGAEMRASFGVFLAFRDGKIVSQRNYDCYEPF